MAGKVTFEVTRGALAGQKFEYDETARVFIGRQEDCGIVLPENTVSRYHCLLEIMPPAVKLQDFGSLNGTFLNGNKIGQREREQSWEEARNALHETYPLTDGDTLGLGSKCELRCTIEAAETCATCGAPLPAGVSGDETVPEGEERAPLHYDASGRRICENCWLVAEKERLEKRIAEKKAAELAAEQAAVAAKQEADRAAAEAAAEAAAAEAAAAEAEADRIEAERLLAEQAKNKPCEIACAKCGKRFAKQDAGDTLCPECRNDRDRVLDGILAVMLGMAGGKAEERPVGPSPVAGYQKVKLLGKGGMGEVWKVRNDENGKYYALKTMLPEIAADADAKKIFLREASVGEALHHKNVVHTYASGCVNGTFYILMDLCEGGSADGLMEKRGGKLPLDLATWITLQVLTGLDYVHNVDLDVAIRKGIFGGTKEVSTKGVVHRDFKPGNIFLSDTSDRPVAMVADLGMAKAFNLAGLSYNTKSGNVMGTPVFMPRQQAMNFKYAKPEVDVWAAASYYHMLTGAFPKNFRTGKNVWQIIITESAVPIRERDASIPAPIAAVIDRALVERPEIGCKTAAALKTELVAALPGDLRNAVKGAI